MVFWDLFCGTGALGLEALSIGASRAVFVDSSAEHLRGVHAFLRSRNALDRADLVRKTLPGSLVDLYGPPGVVYLDPPYRDESVYSWIRSLPWGDLTASGARIFVEAGKPDTLPEWERRRYGSSWLFIAET